MTVRNRRNRWLGLAAAGLFSMMAWSSLIGLGVAVIR